MNINTPEHFDQPPRPGEVLREAREQRGLAVEEVATALNLTVERVQQIEEQQWQLLPGLTFARGYLRQYARLLELEADTLVEQFNQATDTLPTQQVVQERLQIEPSRHSWLNMRLLSLIVLIALAIGGFFWWEGQANSRQDASNLPEIDWALELEESAAAPQPASPPLVPRAPFEAARPPASTSSEPVTENSVEATADMADEAPQPPIPEDETPPQNPPPVDNDNTLATATATPEATPELPNEGVLNFDFSEDCWLQVKDGMGKVLFSGTLSASDKLELSGTPPLELRMGNPRAVNLRYNGERVRVTPATIRLTLGT